MAIANSPELSESDGGSADSTLKLFGQRIPLTHSPAQSPAQSTEVSMEAHENCKNHIDSEGIDEEEGENTSPSSNLESKTCKGIEESKQNRSDQITMAVVSEQSKGLPENARLNKQKSGHNMSEETPTPKKPDKPIPCPRCESLDTKFCYFNNYNVNQPRHFCKQCQRYWTAGGTLRNVPVGAGRRKNKHSMAAAQWQNMHQQADQNLSSNSSDVGADEAQDSVMRLTMMLNHKVCAAPSKAEICAPKFEQAEEIQQMHQSRALLADAAVQSGIGIGSDQQPVNNQTLKREGCDGSLAQVQVPVQVQPTKEENIQNMTNVEAKTTPPAGGYVNSSWPVSWSNGASPPPPPCTVTIPVNQEGGAVMQIPFPWNPSMAGMWGPTWPGMEAAAAAAVAMAPHLWASWGGAIWNNPWGAAAAAGYAAAAAAAAASLGNSGAKGPSVLGKHGREKEGDAAPAGVYAPKTLRIDDPGEAARSSIWTTLGIKAGSSMPFKGFQSTSVKSSEDKSVEAASRINPAAMSRSATFQENH